MDTTMNVDINGKNINVRIANGYIYIDYKCKTHCVGKVEIDRSVNDSGFTAGPMESVSYLLNQKLVFYDVYNHLFWNEFKYTYIYEFEDTVKKLIKKYISEDVYIHNFYKELLMLCNGSNHLKGYNTAALEDDVSEDCIRQLREVVECGAIPLEFTIGVKGVDGQVVILKIEPENCINVKLITNTEFMVPDEIRYHIGNLYRQANIAEGILRLIKYGNYNKKECFGDE